MTSENAGYRGRFAPSPTGPLHFGSLVSAVASHLDARAHGGQWLVRMENIDPPREMPGAADTILRQLEHHGLHWDGPVLYQSQRSDAYKTVLNTLKQQQQLYPCTCSRQQLRQRGGNHGPRCQSYHQSSGEDCAWRVSVDKRGNIHFIDCLQGDYRQDIAATYGDFVLHRKGGLFAYQLTVTVDDSYQRISHVIRGCDLLDSTPRQIFLQRLLGFTTPIYGHLPIATGPTGDKLSKQAHAPAIQNLTADKNLSAALNWLRLPIPGALIGAPCTEQLSWAQQNWSRETLQGSTSAPASL